MANMTDYWKIIISSTLTLSFKVEINQNKCALHKKYCSCSRI